MAFGRNFYYFLGEQGMATESTITVAVSFWQSIA
jgi:hypothetical protein